MKPEPSALSPAWVAERIRAYLVEHPRAADSAAGIQRWWIVPTFGEVSLWSVEQALIQLEKEGVVHKLESFASIATYERGPAFTDTGADDRDEH